MPLALIVRGFERIVNMRRLRLALTRYESSKIHIEVAVHNTILPVCDMTSTLTHADSSDRSEYLEQSCITFNSHLALLRFKKVGDLP